MLVQRLRLLLAVPALLAALVLGGGAAFASSSSWQNSILTPQTTTTFYEVDCDESGCLYIPYQYTFYGDMLESWNGIPTGFAYLVTDEGSATAYWASGSPIAVTDLWTAAYYYDTNNSDGWTVSSGSPTGGTCGWPSGYDGTCTSYTDTLDTLQDYPATSGQYWTEIAVDCSNNDVTPCGAETPTVDHTE